MVGDVLKIKIPSYVKGTRLLLGLEKSGVDVGRFQWKFTTGRLDVNKEWAVMKQLKASKLSDAYESLRSGQDFYESFKSTPKEELMKKRWLTKSDLALGKRIKKHI